MKISLHWLNSYLSRPTDTAEAQHVLTSVGYPVEAIDAVGNDHVMEVEITSNRPDLLSHVGTARELAAATGRSFNPPALDASSVPPLSAQAPAAASPLASIDNRAADLCPVYTARIITGVTVGPSPDWLRDRLQTVGLRSVNNIVDITNFVLHELGQPLHAFDLAKLSGRRVVIRKAQPGENFTAIDNSRHTLRPDMLVIADEHRPVAIAGVMGGLDSEVTSATTDILLESARFDQLSVRATSRSLRLSSDSSYRFERGVDPAGVDAASRRAAQLILQLAGGTLSPVILSSPARLPLIEEPAVTLRPARCTDLLGLDIPLDDMLRILRSLGLQPRMQDQLIHCTIPSHRPDIRREIDLIEEIARLRGYNDIPIESKMHIVARPPQTTVQARRLVTDVLVAHGYHQTITFSFLPPAQAQPFAAGWDIVKVDEEKKKAEPALRPSIVPSLLATRKANQDAGNRDVRLFEIAQVFGSVNNRFVEQRRLALLTDSADAATTLRSMRSTLEELFDRLGLANKLSIAPAPQSIPWLATTAAILDTTGRPIGHFGPVTDAIQKRFDLQTPVIAAELDYDTLISAYPPAIRVQALPRFPAIERDLSVIVDEPVAWASIRKTIEAVDPALLESVDFVTTYRGKPVPAGRKSVTFRMSFREPTRTLLHEEVTEQVTAVVDRLKRDLSAELRV